jgi:RHS repeat-associated protein
VAVQDANGNYTTSVYDALNRVQATVDAGNVRTTTLYDCCGQVQAVLDGQGNRVTNTYDAVGRLTVLEDSLNNRTSYTYDAVGNQTLRLDANGQRTTYQYDAANQPTEVVYQDGSRVTHTYDALGRRTVLADSTGTTSYTYDAASQVTQVAYPGNKTLTNVYDAVGNRTVLQDADGGRTTYTYDALNRLSSLLNPFNERTTYQYDAVSRATTQILGNGAQARSTFDAAGNLTELRNVQSDGTVLSSFAYTCDAVGNRTQVVEANGDVVSWSYDNTYQLTNERRSGANAYNVTYTYDAVGNRTVKEDSGARTTYTYNAGNELVTEQSPTAPTSYTYDANGNTTVKNEAGTRTTYTYDPENRLTQVDTAASSVTYTYDGEGLRRTGPGVKYVWDDQNILLETDNAGSTVVQYTLSEELFGNLVSQRRSGTSSFYHFDGLGSADRLTDANQAVTDSYTYLAFGEEKASSGSTTNPFRYVGQVGYYRDGQTPLLYLRARYYEPGVGRFVTIDPLFGGSNGYVYVKANPVTQVDPSGQLTIDCGTRYKGPCEPGQCKFVFDKIKAGPPTSTLMCGSATMTFGVDVEVYPGIIGHMSLAFTCYCNEEIFKANWELWVGECEVYRTTTDTEIHGAFWGCAFFCEYTTKHTRWSKGSKHGCGGTLHVRRWTCQPPPRWSDKVNPIIYKSNIWSSSYWCRKPLPPACRGQMISQLLPPPS